jgi:hypothetical protein
MKRSKQHPTPIIKHPTSYAQHRVLSEGEELIRIFFSSVQTARRNALLEKQEPPEAQRHLSSKAR